MSELVQVVTEQKSYTVEIGAGVVGATKGKFRNSELVIITDSQVRSQIWFNEVNQQLFDGASKTHLVEIPSGEESKNLQLYAQVCRELASQRFSRKTLIIAVGGGVVGDFAGFVASTYLRGVDFIQVPTTLLAAVDSSVGGKVGVNLPEGKNLVGAFYQPQYVGVDTDLLKTLPPREFSAGMAEVIKYALIADSEFWQELQSTPQPIPLEEWIARCVRLKAHVVAQDELETKGVRAILNFGHTVGHAIEQVSGYGTYLHGEAVAVGMMVATFLSEKIYGIDLLEPLRRVLTAYQLPTQARGLSITAIKEAILRDKKSDGKAVTWVLLKSVGQTEQTQNVPDALLDQALRAFIQEPLP